MRVATPRRLSSALAVALAFACSEAVPTEPEALDEGILTEVMPDLAPERGTVGTDRYVPVLERTLRRAVGVIRETRGDEVANGVAREFRALSAALQEAQQLGDRALSQERRAALENYAARVTVRVFGAPVIRHLVRYGSAQLDALMTRLREAGAAGQDVTRLGSGARRAAALLDRARTSAADGDTTAAVVAAAQAIDLLARLSATL